MPHGSGSAGPTPWVGTDDVHRSTYRVFCALAGVLNPVFGAVYQLAYPDAFEPLWGRFLLSLVALLLLSLSYMDRRVERRFILLVRGYFYLLMAYYVGLTAANAFAYPYALGLLFAFMAMGVAFGLGLSARVTPLLRFLASTLALTVLGGLATPAPEANLWLVWVCVGSTGLIIYVVAEAKIRAEASAQASEHRYHALMNAASDAILIADPASGLLIDGNEKAQALLGRSVEELRRMPFAELFPEGDRDRSAALLAEHAASQRPLSEDLFLVGADREIVPVDLSASLVTIDGRAFIQGIFRRHRYEEQLIQAKERAEELLRLKTSLLNNMSHELRTPLTAILGFSEIMAEEATGEPREYAEVIKGSARRLFDTVDSVLGLAQLESGSPSLDLRPIDIVPFLDESLAHLHSLAQQKSLTLRLDAPRTGRPLRVHADQACLGRIVTNLVGNAIKFTEHGEVVVRVEADRDRVALHVCDTGVGISTDFLPHLFEEFQQESTGLDRLHEGSGLGLAITKRLLDRMGGTIDVESEKGHGTVFTVTLPRSEAPAADPAPAPSHHALGPTGRRVLYVEDNPDMRRLVAHRLSPYCEVVVEADPRAALERATADRFDAYLLDINLTAVQDGVELLAALRRLPGHGRTPSIALTAYALPGAEARFRSSGFDHYLAKPFTTDQLLDVVLGLFPECSPRAQTGRLALAAT